MREALIERFIRYAKVNTRSDLYSQSVPSTPQQVTFAKALAAELIDIGFSEVTYHEKNCFVKAVLPALTTKQDVPAVGFIAHVDTADFCAEGVNPQIAEHYDGRSDIPLDKAGKYVLSPQDFPQLKNYKGQTLITTDGQTLLGADDKAGMAEIITALTYLLNHPEIPRGKVCMAFGPDEEIGRGADLFDVNDFKVDFAYTMDGGPLGELRYQNFNAALAEITLHGKSVHTGRAKGKLINALTIAAEFQKAFPADEVPEKTEGEEGFYHLQHVSGDAETATLSYIIRDHDLTRFEERKAFILATASQLNQAYGSEVVDVLLKDQYYNMYEILKEDMTPVLLAQEAFKALGITPESSPIRGGTDGSKISYMGIPTPNIFCGAENSHGRFEFVSVETMEKAVAVILKIIELNEGKPNT